MGYTYIFYDYLLEIPQKLYLHLLKEVMFQFGGGYSIIITKKYAVKEKGFLNLSLMKP